MMDVSRNPGPEEAGWRRAWPVLALVAAGLALTAPFWRDLQLYGHSSVMDYFRMVSFDRLVRSGILVPRWDPDTYFGHGSPLFHFYAPLAYYVTEAFVLLGLSIHTAIKAALVSTFVLSGLGMFLFCRDVAGRWGSALAGLAFMLAPYHLVDMIVRHAFGEHVAFAFIPFACWGVTGMVRGRRPLRLAVGALALGALVLSHNITAMLGMGAVGLWWLVLAVRTRRAGPIAFGAAVPLVGLLVSLFFWGPALLEKDQTFAQESLTHEFFRYEDHFVHPTQLVVPFWGFGGSRKGVAEDFMSFQVGIPHWLFVAAALLVLVGWRRRPDAVDASGETSAFLLYGLLLFVGAAAFTLPITRPVYEALPLLRYVQFPWRFLVYVAFAASLLAVAVEVLVRRVVPPPRAPQVLGLAALALVGAYGAYLVPRFGFYRQDKREFQMDTASRVRAHRASDPGILDIWELGGGDVLGHLRASGETCTSRDDFLPRTVQRKPRALPQHEARWMGAPGEARVAVRRLDPVDLAVHVTAARAGALEVKRFAFPGWEATVDGAPVQVGTRPAYGTLVVPVPQGEHTVEVRFGSTGLRTVTALVSAATLAGLLVMLVAFGIRRRRRCATRPAGGGAVR